MDPDANPITQLFTTAFAEIEEVLEGKPYPVPGPLPLPSTPARSLEEIAEDAARFGRRAPPKRKRAPGRGRRTR